MTKWKKLHICCEKRPRLFVRILAINFQEIVKKLTRHWRHLKNKQIDRITLIKRQYSPAYCEIWLQKAIIPKFVYSFCHYFIYLSVKVNTWCQICSSMSRHHEQQWTTGGEAAVCTLAIKVSVQRPAAAVISDEGEESCDWCRQALGGIKKKTSMNGATEHEECIPLKPGWLLLRKLALSLILKTRRAEFAPLIPLETANTKARRVVCAVCRRIT